MRLGRASRAATVTVVERVRETPPRAAGEPPTPARGRTAPPPPPPNVSATRYKTRLRRYAKGAAQPASRWVIGGPRRAGPTAAGERTGSSRCRMEVCSSAALELRQDRVGCGAIAGRRDAAAGSTTVCGVAHLCADRSGLRAPRLLVPSGRSRRSPGAAERRS